MSRTATSTSTSSSTPTTPPGISPDAGKALTISQRVAQLKPSATLAVGARVAQLKAQGKDVIAFGAGEPDFDTPLAIRQAAVDALMAGDTHYGPVPGAPEVRAAIAAKLNSENNITCEAGDIVVTVGAKHAIYQALQCLVDPGDDVLIPTPAWVSYAPITELAGGNVVELPGSIDNDFKITPKQLEAAITERTRVLFLNSPSNPCGTMYAPDELRALAEVIARHRQLVVLSDEIYEKLIFTDTPHFSIGSIDAIADRVVTINGMSKAFAMTGWRLGYACAPGRDSAGNLLAKSISKLQSQMTSNVTSFAQAAIPVALRDVSDEVESMRQVFAQRAELIYGRVRAMPHVKVARPTGAFYLFPDVSAAFEKTSPGGVVIDSAITFAQALLDETYVAVVPGNDFGACAVRNIRLSYAASDELINEGCDRLERWLGELA